MGCGKKLEKVEDEEQGEVRRRKVEDTAEEVVRSKRRKLCSLRQNYAGGHHNMTNCTHEWFSLEIIFTMDPWAILHEVQGSMRQRCTKHN